MNKENLKQTLATIALLATLAIIFLVVDNVQIAQTIPTPLSTEETEAILATPENHSQPNFLVIPSLGITAPIIFVDQTDEAVFQKALESGVVHYPGTAAIGELGNAYIFGHSSDYAWAPGSYKTVFAPLPKMETGQAIIATNDQGKEFEYRVIETRIVAANDTSVLDQKNNEQKLLTLQTSYPVGTALRRFIVVAQLIN